MTQVLPIIGATGLRPFLPLLMAHVSSAMTSLSDAVRCAPAGNAVSVDQSARTVHDCRQYALVHLVIFAASPVLQ